MSDTALLFSQQQMVLECGSYISNPSLNLPQDLSKLEAGTTATTTSVQAVSDCSVIQILSLHGTIR